MPSVVSLKRYLDPGSNSRLATVIASYKTLLTATGECGSQVCPPAAGDFAESLQKLQAAVSTEITAEQITATETAVQQQLNGWRDRTFDYYKQKTADVRELLMVVARTAESVGARDQRYGQSFRGLTERLQAISELEDVTKLRSSLAESVGELSKTVEQMSLDSQQAVEFLQKELSTYRAKLEETEQAASADALTGVANRRKLESELDLRMKLNKTFCIVMADLNGLKETNDRIGHLAGDQLLKHFAKELVHVVRASDLVGRWGGDEFLILLDCEGKAARATVDRIRQWVFGEYALKVNEGAPSIKIPVSAGIGLAIWRQGMTLAELIQRADEAMYRDKTLQKAELQSPHLNPETALP
jgi:diguanylate cyclase (GGDEF)-like protein